MAAPLQGKFKGQKTYIVAALGIITALGAYLVGDMEAGTMGKIAFDALLAIFLRRGMTRETEQTVKKIEDSAVTVVAIPTPNRDDEP